MLADRTICECARFPRVGAADVSTGELVPAAAAAGLESPSSVSEWLVWQLVDSAFPTGGFAHSNGLESAWHHGVLRDGPQLVGFVEASLQQLGHAVLPFVTAAAGEPERLEDFDQLCDAFTTNHVANRASRLQGRAFLAAISRVFPDHGWPGSFGAPSLLRPVLGHFAPVFGASLAGLGLARRTVLRLFVFNHLRGLVAAAVRLNIVGTMEAQRLQHQLARPAAKVLEECGGLGLEAISQTAPLLDLWQGTHDRLYSRLFQS